MEELTGKDKKFVREFLVPKYPGILFEDLLELYADNKENVDYTIFQERYEKNKNESRIKDIVEKRKKSIYNKQNEKNQKKWNKALLESRKDEISSHSFDFLDHNIGQHLPDKYIGSDDGLTLIKHFRKHDKMINKYDRLKKDHDELNEKYEQLMKSDKNKSSRMGYAISDSKERHKEKREELYQQLLKQYYDFKVKLDKPIYNFIMMLLGIIRSG